MPTKLTAWPKTIGGMLPNIGQFMILGRYYIGITLSGNYNIIPFSKLLVTSPLACACWFSQWAAAVSPYQVFLLSVEITYEIATDRWWSTWKSGSKNGSGTLAFCYMGLLTPSWEVCKSWFVYKAGVHCECVTLAIWRNVWEGLLWLKS